MASGSRKSNFDLNLKLNSGNKSVSNKLLSLNIQKNKKEKKNAHHIKER